MSVRFGKARVASSRAEDAEDVLFLHDEVLLAVDLDLAARVLPEQDAVPGLDLLGLLLGGIGDDDPAVLDLTLFEALDQDPVVQRAEVALLGMNHGASPSLPVFANWMCGVAGGSGSVCRSGRNCTATIAHY